MRPARLALIGLAGLVLVLVAVAALLRATSGTGGADEAFRGSIPPSGVALPSFAARDHLGRPVRSEELRGKVVVLTLLDSQCVESCPVIATVLGRGLDRLTGEERGRVAAVAVSTDPAEDTRVAVARFLRERRAVGRFAYLVAPEPEIRRLWRELQVLSSLETGDDNLHSAPVRVYGAEGEWLSTLHAGADLTEENLVHDVRLALAREEP